MIEKITILGIIRRSLNVEIGDFMQIKIISSLDKCFLDEKIADKKEFSNASCFKNEIFRFGICYSDEEQSFVRLTVNSPLKNYINVRRVTHIPVQKAAEDTIRDDYYLRYDAGLYPDLLLPLGKFNRLPVSRNLQSLFIEVDLDGTVTAGKYPIEFVFTNENDENKVYKANFNLEVIDASLPSQELKLTQWFYCDCLMDYYGVSAFSERHWEIIENFMKTAVKNGINMILTPVFTPALDTYIGGERPTVQLVGVNLENGKYSFDFTKLNRWVDLCEKVGIKYFEMAHLFTQWGAKHTPKIMANVNGEEKRIFGWDTDALSEEYTEFLRAFIPELLSFMKVKGVFERCYFHISDEPAADCIEQYKKAKAIVEPLLEGRVIMDALSHYEYYEQGIVKNPVSVTHSVEKFYENDVPDLWTYYCCGPADRYYSNRFMSMPSNRNRIIGIQMYKFDIKGFLHWGYNFYYNRFSYDSINPYLYSDSDYFGCAGDSFLVYPAPDGTAYESIRAAVFHDALQDMRALKLCESIYGKEYVMNLIEDGIKPITFNEYPHSDEYIPAVRERINNAVKAALKA